MTVPETMTDLVDSAGAWKDAVEETSVVASRSSMSLLADCLDAPLPVDEVPPMWLAATASWPAAESLGEDGHPLTGLGYPPLERRRRLFAGGTVRVLSPVAIEEPLTRRSRVSWVQAKSGRSGPLLFVTVAHDYLDAGAAIRVEEEHQLVYRSAAEAVVPLATAVPGTTTPTVSPADRSLTLVTDPLRLFRFSALTANSHRIHYDETYATAVEGHAGVIVHGPLLAMLALELPRRYAEGRRVSSYAYRLRHPAVSGSALLTSVVDEQPNHWVVDVRADGVVTLTGEIHLDAEES
jgi:hydroxyacyl-ACP dehydratase HTD2-like protein with hotdog domain